MASIKSSAGTPSGQHPPEDNLALPGLIETRLRVEADEFETIAIHITALSDGAFPLLS